MRIVSLLVSIISLFLFSSALYAGETYGEELGQLVGLSADRAMALEEGAMSGDLAPWKFLFG